MENHNDHNDHNILIDQCICGGSPEVMGDDFDADVSCPKCGRTTPDCCGTKNAIKYWNKNKGKLFPENKEYYNN
jgi:hypothetical protein